MDLGRSCVTQNSAGTPVAFLLFILDVLRCHSRQPISSCISKDPKPVCYLSPRDLNRGDSFFRSLAPFSRDQATTVGSPTHVQLGIDVYQSLVNLTSKLPDNH